MPAASTGMRSEKSPRFTAANTVRIWAASSGPPLSLRFCLRLVFPLTMRFDARMESPPLKSDVNQSPQLKLSTGHLPDDTAELLRSPLHFVRRASEACDGLPNG